ncbi:MAG: tyrosine--tRNA ligase [Candidatus Liptonbacteria bacterium]|nr:tyrosine--tRNA ligase [Candidatus Liptonbacteria bacterium]
MDTLLTKGVHEVIVRDHLERALKSGKKLRVKFGIDPTSPELHLGHLVPLLKLKQFQDVGHKIVLIIGDFTAVIGDPSGRSETRKPLTAAQVRANFKTYLKQAGKILDVKKIEVHNNSVWYKKGGQELLLQLAARVSAQQLLEREDFQKRMKAGEAISALEMLYPVFQGYDSVAVKADVEIGGTDQKFNLLMGRRLQRSYGLQEQNIITTPLLVGTDGIRKMSKSYGNFIALSDKPADVFGKTMSVPDALLKNYFELLTSVEYPEALSPYDAKQLLAGELVRLLYGEKEMEKSKENFQKVFSKKEIPEDMPTIGLDVPEIAALDLLLLSGIKSKSEARRLIAQKAVDVENVTIQNPEEIISVHEPVVLKVGKKRFFKVVRI